MIRIFLFFITFLFFSSPSFAIAGESWVAQLASVVIDSSSHLSLRLYDVFQRTLLPFIGLLFAMYLVFYAIKLLKDDSMDLRGAWINIAKRGWWMGLSYALMSLPPKFFFDLTIVPLLDIGLYYGSEILNAADSGFSTCFHTLSYTPVEGIFSPELQARFVCLVDYLYTSLMVGISMGIWLIVSALPLFVTVILVPVAVLKIIFAVILIKSFADIMVDLLWRFIDTTFRFIIGAILIPFAIVGWVMKGEETGILPDIGSWEKKPIEYFKSGVVHLIFWCINIGLIQFLVLAALSDMSFPLGGEILTPEAILSKSQTFFTAEGELRETFMSAMAFSFFPNISQWLLLLAVAILGKHLIQKTETLAESFGASYQGDFADDLKETGKRLGKWGHEKYKEVEKFGSEKLGKLLKRVKK
ncbi:MAG: hypothetical protein JXR30_02660 [Alphaproteobacteria bacterium]|nr:hypothetical protein [Alphaproteobacteria bacterium]